MKTILGDQVLSHNLMENTKPALYLFALHANYGRGKIEEKYDAYTNYIIPSRYAQSSMLIIAKSSTDSNSRGF